MIVLICGGRNFDNKAQLTALMDAIHKRRPITKVVEGGALGADRLGQRWASSRGIPVKTVPAEWERYGGRAGSARNCKMLREEKPKLVVAFAGGAGTAHMVRISKEANVRTIEAWKLNPLAE